MQIRGLYDSQRVTGGFNPGVAITLASTSERSAASSMNAKA